MTDYTYEVWVKKKRKSIVSGIIYGEESIAETVRKTITNHEGMISKITIKEFP